MNDRIASAAMMALTLGLLAALPAWRMSDAPPPDAFAEPAPDFLARAEDFAARHATGLQVDGLPLVKPPPGDVPVVARRYEFTPALELEAGKTYRLHVASVDTVHSLAVDGRELLLVPGQTRVIELTPSAPGPLALQCGEYCGLSHTRMRGSITVTGATAPPAAR
jgi:cytochrome c oxidase subunit 2